MTWGTPVETSAENMPGSGTKCQVWHEEPQGLKIIPLQQQFMTFILDGIRPPEPVRNIPLDNVVQGLLWSVKWCQNFRFKPDTKKYFF